MPLLAWLVGLVTDEGATSALGRVAREVVGTTEEAALEAALRNATRVVAAEVVASTEAQTFAAAAIAELISGEDVSSRTAGSALDDLEAAVGAAVASLWNAEPDNGVIHADELGIGCSAEELTSLLVSEFVRSLGLACDGASSLAPLIALLSTQQNRRDLDQLLTANPGMLPRHGRGEQATKVNAWVSTATDPPRVFVVNDSDSPIFDVQPTPALIGYRRDGEVSAIVGHSPCETARQIDPHGGYCWPLEHCRGWGGMAAVKGQVHVTFRDATGQGWVLGHDRLVPADVDQRPPSDAR